MKNKRVEEKELDKAWENTDFVPDAQRYELKELNKSITELQDFNNSTRKSVIFGALISGAIFASGAVLVAGIGVLAKVVSATVFSAFMFDSCSWPDRIKLRSLKAQKESILAPYKDKLLS